MHDASPRSRFRIPDPMVLIFFVLVFAAIATHVVPAGAFETELVDGKTRVVPGTYHAVTGAPAGVFDVFVAVPRGMLAAARYLFIVFIAGGLFRVLDETGALENAVGVFVRKIGLANRKVIIWMTTFVFGFFGVAVGFENNIALVPVALLVSAAIGAGRLVGVGMAVGGIGVGFALSPINPYTVGVSQQLAELPLFSGALLRATLVVVALAAVAAYVSRAVDRSERDEDDDAGLSKSLDDYRLGFADYKVLGIFVGGLVFMLWGVFTEGWYIKEIAGAFLAIAIIVGVACRMPGETIVRHMVDGAAAVTGGALIIGLAASIQVVLKDGRIIDTVILGLSSVLSSMPVTLAAICTSVVQGIINFFIPSGSGQAMVTMPILIPLGDLLGISRQTMILAFQVGDGLTNLIVPTSGGTLAMLAMGRVSYGAWLRFIFPLIAVIYGVSWLFIAVAVAIQW
ncbi:MAG: TIGR00366 family protein [Deltaproteobacteria bacterium]|jgi:uncharacterized ion transporter superfamily protein YfcC